MDAREWEKVVNRVIILEHPCPLGQGAGNRDSRSVHITSRLLMRPVHDIGKKIKHDEGTDQPCQYKQGQAFDAVETPYNAEIANKKIPIDLVMLEAPLSPESGDSLLNCFSPMVSGYK